MLTLDGTQLLLKNLRISVRQQLAGKDMSGQTSATDQAETGSKGKTLAVSGVVPFDTPELLSRIFTLAGQQDNGARHVYRINNRTAETLKVRQVKFQGAIRADEQDTLRQWSVSFELVEHLSVPERVEQRQPDKPAAQQQAQGIATPVTASAEQPDVPPGTEVELTGWMKVAKGVDNLLA